MPLAHTFVLCMRPSKFLHKQHGMSGALWSNKQSWDTDRPVEHHNKRSQLSQAIVRPVGWYWQTAGASHCPAPVNRTDCFIKLTRGSSAACRGSKSTRGSISESCFSSVFLNVITCRPNAHLNQALVNWYCCMEFAETHETRHKESCLWRSQLADATKIELCLMPQRTTQELE